MFEMVNCEINTTIYVYEGSQFIVKFTVLKFVIFLLFHLKWNIFPCKM